MAEHFWFGLADIVQVYHEEPGTSSPVPSSLKRIVFTLYVPQWYLNYFHINTSNKPTSEDAPRVNVLGKITNFNFWPFYLLSVAKYTIYCHSLAIKLYKDFHSYTGVLMVLSLFHLQMSKNKFQRASISLQPWPWPWILGFRFWSRHISGMGGPIDMGGN